MYNSCFVFTSSFSRYLLKNYQYKKQNKTSKQRVKKSCISEWEYVQEHIIFKYQNSSCPHYSCTVHKNKNKTIKTSQIFFFTTSTRSYYSTTASTCRELEPVKNSVLHNNGIKPGEEWVTLRSTHARTHTHTRARVLTHTHMCAHTHMPECTHTHTHTHTHKTTW